MLPSVLLVAASAIAIAPPGSSDEGCPSARQVSDALALRLPWALAPAGPASPPGTLRLAVGSTASGGLRVQLTDATGEQVLVRALPAPARARSGDCAALAETVVLIVDRYLRDVGFEAPPLPPPPAAPAVVARPPAAQPPRAAPAPSLWQVGLAFEGRYGDTAVLDGSALLSFGREGYLGGQRAGLCVAGGIGPNQSARWQEAQASMMRIPLRLGAYLAFRAGPGRIEPGVGVGADLLQVSVASSAPNTGGAELGGGTHFAPFGNLALGYALPLGRYLYVRGMARGGAAVPYRFFTQREGAEVWSTPRTYLELGLESGVFFP